MTYLVSDFSIPTFTKMTYVSWFRISAPYTPPLQNPSTFYDPPFVYPCLLRWGEQSVEHFIGNDQANNAVYAFDTISSCIAFKSDLQSLGVWFNLTDSAPNIRTDLILTLPAGVGAAPNRPGPFGGNKQCAAGGLGSGFNPNITVGEWNAFFMSADLSAADANPNPVDNSYAANKLLNFVFNGSVINLATARYAGQVYEPFNGVGFDNPICNHNGSVVGGTVGVNDVAISVLGDYVPKASSILGLSDGQSAPNLNLSGVPQPAFELSLTQVWFGTYIAPTVPNLAKFWTKQNNLLYPVGGKVAADAFGVPDIWLERDSISDADFQDNQGTAGTFSVVGANPTNFSPSPSDDPPPV